METSQRRAEARAEARAAVRTRIGTHITTHLDEKAQLQLAIGCALRTPDDVVAFMFSTPVARIASAKHNDIAITVDEWTAIFGSTTPHDPCVRKSTIVLQEQFAADMDDIAKTLNHTLAEREQGELYESPHTRALIYVAMHAKNPDPMLQAVIGNLVRQDSRRLSELWESIDDAGGASPLLMAQVIISLSETVL